MTEMASGRIPSLDGLRAVSVVLVLVYHNVDWSVVGRARPLLEVVGNGQLGVSVFFVISGYLITTLLLRELDAAGSIGLKNFYLRRAFRILPACFAYLGTVLLLARAGILEVPFREWLSSAAFLRDYVAALGIESGRDAFTSHCWSLAVEEQFYIFWPACLAALGRRRGAWLAAGLIAASPASRVATYLAFPGLRASLGVMAHTRLDTIMFGCLAALLADSEGFRAVVRRATGTSLPWLAVLFAVVISPTLARWFGGSYVLLIGYGLEGASLTLVMLWLIGRPHSVAGQFLNNRAVAHLGVISYSFYLWQQLFCGLHFPWSVAPTLLMAEGSYWLIERPALGLRGRLLRGVRPGPQPPLAAAPLAAQQGGGEKLG